MWIERKRFWGCMQVHRETSRQVNMRRVSVCETIRSSAKNPLKTAGRVEVEILGCLAKIRNADINRVEKMLQSINQLEK